MVNIAAAASDALNRVKSETAVALTPALFERFPIRPILPTMRHLRSWSVVLKVSEIVGLGKAVGEARP
ncbi:MAG TPA: hypothetical protein VFO69_14285 [Allosphingosinicella sp.]|nr:hypothetical protein [Allosphingosinicella sp.]